jgi:hypothetical protein
MATGARRNQAIPHVFPVPVLFQSSNFGKHYVNKSHFVETAKNMFELESKQTEVT